MTDLKEGVIAEKAYAPIPGVKGKGPYGFQVLLLEKSVTPDTAWLARQDDERLRSHYESRWWRVMILPGYVYAGDVTDVPEPLLSYVREPSYDDLMALVEHANIHGRRTIAALFPDLIENALREQRR